MKGLLTLLTLTFALNIFAKKDELLPNTEDKSKGEKIKLVKKTVCISIKSIPDHQIFEYYL